jgi:cytoskeletal protein RodZ
VSEGEDLDVLPLMYPRGQALKRSVKMVESVGKRLQQARLAKKLEIEDVAEKTKIRPNRIIDLEADEYAHFPNLTYARSFLAKYARFLGVDIQEELEKLRASKTISVGDYQYLRSGSPQKFVQEPRRIEAIGFRVPPAVVVVLILIVLVGVPVFSYLALNITRQPGSNQVAPLGNTLKSGDESANPAVPSQSVAGLTQSIATSSPADTNSARLPPNSSRQGDVKESATPMPLALQAQIQDGIEVRSAPPTIAPESTTSTETPTKTSLSTLPERKLEVRVLKRTYVKVTKDEEGTQPVFEGYAAPGSHPIVFEGKRFWVHVSEKGAVEVRKDGQLVLGSSGDIVIN